jgi:hypothetical protein
MSDKRLGLLSKFRVEHTDGKPVGWCFVLQDTDPLAIPALKAYATAAREAGYAILATDLEAKARKMTRTMIEAKHEAGIFMTEPSDEALPIVFKAMCTCGWKGQRSFERSEAREHGRKHLAEVLVDA